MCSSFFFWAFPEVNFFDCPRTTFTSEGYLCCFESKGWWANISRSDKATVKHIERSREADADAARSAQPANPATPRGTRLLRAAVRGAWRNNGQGGGRARAQPGVWKRAVLGVSVVGVAGRVCTRARAPLEVCACRHPWGARYTRERVSTRTHTGHALMVRPRMAAHVDGAIAPLCLVSPNTRRARCWCAL